MSYVVSVACGGMCEGLTVEEIPEGDTPFYCKRCISPPRIDTAADRIVPALDISMPLGVVADMGMKFMWSSAHMMANQQSIAQTSLMA